MLPDPHLELLPLTPEEREIWGQVLEQRPQFGSCHDPECPGITITLHAHRDSCDTCRVWLADALREDRELEAEGRRRGHKREGAGHPSPGSTRAFLGLCQASQRR
ncbi:MAG: hypothetical protein IPP07_29460 [Holophagales bacterium]|nr:hypothetical protein [Holophagales bacterium]